MIVFKLNGIFDYKTVYKDQWKNFRQRDIGQIIYNDVSTKNKVYGSEFDPYDKRLLNAVTIPASIALAVVSFGVIPVFTFGKRYAKILETQYIALEVPVGTYSLSEVITTKNETINPAIKSFEVKEKDVIYLGDLNINIYNTNVCINSIDNFETAKSFINNKFKNISDYKITKNLIHNENSDCIKYLAQ